MKQGWSMVAVFPNNFALGAYMYSKTIPRVRAEQLLTSKNVSPEMSRDVKKETKMQQRLYKNKPTCKTIMERFPRL